MRFFQIAFMCAEKNLGEVLSRVEKIAVNMQPPRLVTFDDEAPSEKKGGKGNDVCSNIDLTRMKTITSAGLKEKIKEAGGAPTSLSYYVKQLITAKRIRPIAGQRGVYKVL
jgi:hypothetical protein